MDAVFFMKDQTVLPDHFKSIKRTSAIIELAGRQRPILPGRWPSLAPLPPERVPWLRNLPEARIGTLMKLRAPRLPQLTCRWGEARDAQNVGLYRFHNSTKKVG